MKANLFFSLVICPMLLVAGAERASAAKFANQFVEFELPPKWQCNLEGAEWVCQHTEAQKKRDAIIILAAKLRGEQDTLDQYLDYLKQSKSYTNVQNKPVKSEVKYAKSLQLNEHAWIDALHLESEIPGFYTRYLATIKQDIGVLVTYSINKATYQTYLNDFESMVKTLKVFRKAGGLNANPASGNLFTDTKIPQDLSQNTVFQAPPQAPGDTGSGTQRPTATTEDDLMLYALGAGVLIVLFILWRRRRSG